jgi:hypothetical protein
MLIEVANGYTEATKSFSGVALRLSRERIVDVCVCVCVCVCVQADTATWLHGHFAHYTIHYRSNKIAFGQVISNFSEFDQHNCKCGVSVCVHSYH